MHYSDNFKKVHFGNTLLFMLCIVGISIEALRQAGLDWWLVFSISGYSLFTILFIMSVYVFVLFRGMVRNDEPDIEHPLTSLKIYKILYSITPMLGFIAGLLSQVGVDYEISKRMWLFGCEMGSFWITILIWVLLDPLFNFLECRTPASMQSRQHRMELARQEKEKILAQRKKLLAELSEKEKIETVEQKKILDVPADKLSDLMLSGLRGSAGANNPVVIELGVNAWQLGGIKCMKLLRDMAWEKCVQKGLRPGMVDEVDYWWDGIGDWRAKSL